MKGLIFTYALTYGGAVMSLFNPFYGLLIYICFAIIKPEALWHWSVPSGNYSRIVAIALLVGWVIHGCGDWRLGRARGVIVAFIGFWVWGTISGLLSMDSAGGWSFTEETAKVLLPFLVGVTMVRSDKQLKMLAWTIVLSQGYLAYDVNLSYLADGLNKMSEMGSVGVDNNSAAIAMCTAVGLAFYLGMSSQRWWQKGLAMTLAFLLTHAILLSFSRGGMLALCIVAVATFLLIPKRPTHYAMFALALIAALWVTGPEVMERFQSAFADTEERDDSADSRIELWKDCWEVMQANPILGIGPKNWRRIAYTFGWPSGKAAHSTWFEIGAETGFPGVTLLIALFMLPVWHSWKTIRTAAAAVSPLHRDVARMSIVAIVGFLASASFVTAWGVEIGYYSVLLGSCNLVLVGRQSQAAYAISPANLPTPIAPQGAEFAPARYV